MSNEEIPVGSRWRWSGTPEGRFWEVTGHAGESVFMVLSNGGSTCTPIASFRNGVRIDAPPATRFACHGMTHMDGCDCYAPPAVQVVDDSALLGAWQHSDIRSHATRILAPPAVKAGDVCFDPALLREGMLFAWEGDVDNPGPHRWISPGDMLQPYVRKYGVRILALPEPAKSEAPVLGSACERHEDPRMCSGDCRYVYGKKWPAKAEAPCIDCGLAGQRECRCDDRASPPPPARCAPGCTPAAPCCTEGVCPAWKELRISRDMDKRISRHVHDEWPPPARRHTPPPLRHEGACIAGWNGRVPRG